MEKEHKDIKRMPITRHLCQFRSCELCNSFNRPRNCCYDLYDYSVIYVPEGNINWNELEIQIWEQRQSGKPLRLIIDQNIPTSILWAASYSADNVLQINVNMTKPIDSMEWITILAHAAERCGLYFMLMVYPIIPKVVKVKDVLSVIDTVRALPYCKIKLRFAEFTNPKVPQSDTYVNVNGVAMSKTLMHRNKVGRWKCSLNYQREFLSLIQAYTDSHKLIVDICGS